MFKERKTSCEALIIGTEPEQMGEWNGPSGNRGRDIVEIAVEI